MDKSQWDKISEEKVGELTKVAKKHGITFESNGFTYGEENCTFKTAATVNDASGQKKDLDRETFITWAKKFPTSYNPDWLDKQFTDKGRTYVVVGLKPGAKRFPIVTRRDDGKSYNWPSYLVQMKFQTQAASK